MEEEDKERTSSFPASNGAIKLIKLALVLVSRLAIGGQSNVETLSTITQIFNRMSESIKMVIKEYHAGSKYRETSC